MEGTKKHDSARKRDLARQMKGTEGDAFEREIETGQRTHGVPPQNTVGGVGPDTEPTAGKGGVQGHELTGADVAPTEQAQERERARHAAEREIGRAPAGHDGQLRDHRAPGVTREQLDEAARKADERVAGRPLGRKDH